MSALPDSLPSSALALFSAWENLRCPDAHRFTQRWKEVMIAALAELNAAQGTHYSYYFDLCLWTSGTYPPEEALAFMRRELLG